MSETLPVLLYVLTVVATIAVTTFTAGGESNGKVERCHRNDQLVFMTGKSAPA